MPFPRKVLVANRGEIAVRVVRACREVGAEAVAVFSEVDRRALHVRLADEAYPIGEAKAQKSYLDIEKLVSVARRAGCDAVHPGYGFLAENAAFVEAVERAGIAFLGPDPHTMRTLGDKIAARKEATAAGVPTVPGGVEPVRDESDLEARALEVGYPLVIKAAGGGGGKGIRIVREPRDLFSAYRLASSEAGSAFGDARVYVERFLEAARHVEVQLLGDGRGAVVALGERECSLQRRQQKLVEETPAPGIGAETRQALLEAAASLGRRLAYRSAGTVEFLVSGGDRFYFMEVNARLQVEHPVTELVTGLDLVKEQLRIGAGEPLGYTQAEVLERRRGAAIEVRVNAEDPGLGFAPSAGTIDALRLPGGPGVRVDTGLTVGDKVTLHYDSLLAKLSVWGRDRAEAAARLRRALAEMRVGGVATTIAFLRRLVASPEFERADFHIHFLEPFARAVAAEAPGEEEAAAAALAVALRRAAGAGAGTGAGADPSAARDGRATGDPSPWARAGRYQDLGRSGGRP